MNNIGSAKRREYFWLVVILLLGTALRFYGNLQISLWHDEAFSALMIRYPWPEMFYRLGLDVHPPAYYVALRLWSYIFGSSLLSLRAMSVLFGVGSIWAGFLVAKQVLAGSVNSLRAINKAALWAALLIAINPFQLRYVTEARMYTMGAFFILLAGYFLAKALNEQKEFFEDQSLHIPNLPKDISLHRHFVWHYFAFALCCAVSILTHYYLLFTVAALCFYGLVFHIAHYKTQYKKYFELGLSYLVIVFCFLPWLKVFLFQYRQVQGGYWIEKMNIWSIPSTFWDMLFGFARNTAKPSTQNILAVVCLAVLYIVYRFLKKTQSFHKWLVVFAVLAPFLGALFFAFFAKLKGGSPSVYLDRYFLFAGVYFCILVAVWLREGFPKWLSVSLFLAYCVLNFSAYVNFWADLKIETKPGMSGAARFLKSNVAAKDKLYVGSSFVFFNFKYYWTETGKPGPDNWIFDGSTGHHFVSNVRPMLYTNGTAKAEEISHVTGKALLADQDLLPDFKSSARIGDTVWLIWTNGFYATKPQVPLNWALVGEWGFDEVRPLYSHSSVYVTEYRVN